MHFNVRSFLLIFGCFISSAHAVNIGLTYDGQQIAFTQGTDYGEYMSTPRLNLNAMQKAKSVILNTPKPSNTQEVVLRNVVENKEVRIPLNIEGIHYFYEGQAELSPLPSGTANVSLQANQVTISGEGTANHEVVFHQEQTPFKGAQIFFKQWTLKTFETYFQNVKAPRGEYDGTLNLSVPYEYNAQGAKKIGVINIPVHFKITYRPDHITKVNVVGDGVMKTNYQNETVSGETLYQLQAQGYFSTGLEVGLSRLLADQNSLYELKSEKHSDRIKYNITCVTGCDAQQEWVINGIAQINATDKKVKITRPFTDKIDLDVKVHFDQQPKMESGYYQDKFVLIFSPII